MKGIFRYVAVAVVIFHSLVDVTIAQSGQSSGKMRMSGAQMTINMLLDSAQTDLDDSPQKSFDYVDRALELSISGQLVQSEADCYKMLGKVSYALEQYDLSVDYLKKALLLLNGRNEDVEAQIYLHLGQALEKNLKYDESIDYYKKYLTYVSDRKMTDEIVSVRYDLARVYTSQGDYGKALREYETIQGIEENTNNPTGLANVSTKQGDIYLEQEKSKEAIAKYKQAVDLAQESKDEELQTNSLRKLGKAYRSNKQYSEELEVRQQSLDINRSANKLDEQAEDNLSIGEIYIEQDKPAQAVEYIKKSIDLSEQSGSDEKKGMALKTLSEAYKDQGAYDKALYAYKDYTALVDTTYARRERELRHNLALVASINRKLQRIDLLEKDYELNRRTLEVLQKEQDLRSKELKSQKRITYSLLFVIAALLTSSLLVYRSSVQKKKANLLLALRSLRSQMNPHFIFNSLNSVNSFIAQNNERLANKYLSDFSLLMRMVLENSKHDFVPVASEIEIINLYLKLEHFRFSDKFDFTIDIDEAINLSETRIPPMLIQPYIENAIWHGLRYKESKGTLEVKLKKADDFIIAVISDDGIGRKLSQELKTKHQKAGSSTGMKNTNNRLEIINEIYKTKFRVNIEDLNTEDGTGTIVEIRIPVSENKDGD